MNCKQQGKPNQRNADKHRHEPRSKRIITDRQVARRLDHQRANYHEDDANREIRAGDHRVETSVGLEHSERGERALPAVALRLDIRFQLLAFDIHQVEAASRGKLAELCLSMPLLESI